MKQSTQSFIDIKEVRDNIIILKSGEMRAIISTSSLNLALQSTEEQDATMAQFQGFLNSLEFDLQVMIQSRRYNLSPYIETLNERVKVIEEDLMQVQTRDYIRFIQFMNDQVNIMRKRFYVTIPYGGSSNGDGSIFSTLLGKKKKNAIGTTENQLFEERRSQLEQRVSIVEQGLIGLGLEVTRLETKEILELFYELYNPGEGHTISNAGPAA